MRPDLAKCTTESPRHGRGRAITRKYGGRVQIRHDDEHDYANERGGFHSSSRNRQEPDGGKSFSDCLGALRGNIRKSVGRPWDDVYSEFCQNLDRRGISGYHIWTHLMQEVGTKTFMQDGKVMEFPKYGAGSIEVSGFYVHPETGRLEYCPESWRGWKARWRNQKVDPEIPVPGMGGWSYKRINGLWFRCSFREIENYRTMRTERVVADKRSASKKEIAWIRRQLTKS